MGTQHTPPVDPKDLETPETDRDDLGIPEEEAPVAEDPTGYVAKANPEEVMGRRVRRVTQGDLQEAHNRYAGNKPMFGPSSFAALPEDGEDEQKKGMPKPQQQGNIPRSESKGTRQEAQRLMPSFLKGEQAAAPEEDAWEADPSYESPYTKQPMESQSTHDLRMTQATAGLEYLTQQEAAASARGDHLAAEQAREMAENLSKGFDVERTPQTTGRHPAVKKLLSNLGLEKIKNATIDWGGSEWTFGPTNSRLDLWVGDNMSESGLNIAALLISASLVGLDNVPIYEALGVPLDVEYSIRDKKSGEKRSVNVALYRKYCDCGLELNVDAHECPSCKMIHDPFSIPTDLRLKCAEMFYEMLENEFGAYEELAYLLNKKQEVMKDRQLDKEELFPLAMPSQDPKTTDTSQSGDE